MTDVSTMFLNDLSVVDHAYIDNFGNIIGGSFNPSFLVTGKLDPVEKVVVDFSTIKNRLKAMIDDDDLGFDHKCWIVEGMSHCDVLINGEWIKDFNLLNSDHFDHNAPVEVRTANVRMTAPKNAFKFIPQVKNFENYGIHNAGVWFEQYLNELFAPEGITVTCNNNVHIHTYWETDAHPAAYFSYVHGLKDSTSWGCQNLGHGHLSFMQVESNAGAEAEMRVMKKISKVVNNTVFINEINVTEDSTLDDNWVGIKYTTGRGEFKGQYNTTPSNSITMKVVVLPNETTIEFLVEYIKNTFAEDLASIKATGLFVSEGLSKGAYVKL